jgi:hypothetical protein
MMRLFLGLFIGTFIKKTEEILFDESEEDKKNILLKFYKELGIVSK